MEILVKVSKANNEQYWISVVYQSNRSFLTYFSVTICFQFSARPWLVPQWFKPFPSCCSTSLESFSSCAEQTRREQRIRNLHSILHHLPEGNTMTPARISWTGWVTWSQLDPKGLEIHDLPVCSGGKWNSSVNMIALSLYNMLNLMTIAIFLGKTPPWVGGGV